MTEETLDQNWQSPEDTEPIEATLHAYYIDRLGREQKFLLRFSQDSQELHANLDRIHRAAHAALKELEATPLSIQLELLSGKVMYQRPTGRLFTFPLGRTEPLPEAHD